ncbi:hypothetical protein HYPSUDRAFT_67492 [Hypholoma sublateritium FD-334 SS-4]|uniref:Uncharacterized protein n=1 Tax=Hypholoma sublateritium (strain FD-334 SS-4) TaxID=945553 RepID=A0A0D2L4N8_HYPSF|nr:hypothetical protein HYPSUDRAFT_67492 [Hypholoma sublateritium FD-334 SS-4]
MHAANEEKRRAVQMKINRAVALGWACEGYTDLVSTFRTETAPALHAALDAEGKRVEGYLDALRAAIVQPLPMPDACFVQEVREALGTSRATLPDAVRELCSQVAVSDKMVGVPLGGASSGEWPEISVGVERNQRLLERKAAKMDYGFGIVEEVRTLLSDVRRLK